MVCWSEWSVFLVASSAVERPGLQTSLSNGKPWLSASRDTCRLIWFPFSIVADFSVRGSFSVTGCQINQPPRPRVCEYFEGTVAMLAHAGLNDHWSISLTKLLVLLTRAFPLEFEPLDGVQS
jgi:hypothetical protein